MKILRVEPTPNPNALKYVLDRPILTWGSRSYGDPESASQDPLAKALFAIDGVASVFYMDDFVTITKRPEALWTAISDRVTQVLEAWSTEEAGEQARVSPEEQNELLRRITEVIDRRVRPALAADGGGLEILGLEGYTLRIRYQGACGSCPSSIAGTLQAISNLLRHEVDERLTVIPG